jgi:chromosomal replication initiation ATPase DnaA
MTLLAAPAADHADLCWLLEEATAAAFRVPPNELHAPSRRSADIAFARQSAMYLAHVMLGLSYSAVGRLFGRDRTTAAHACRRVEDRRDDPAIDRMLDILEDVCGEAIVELVAPPVTP